MLLPDPKQNNNHLQHPRTMQIPERQPWFSQPLSFFLHSCSISHYSYQSWGICFLDRNRLMGSEIWVHLRKPATTTEPLPDSKHERNKKSLKKKSINIWDILAVCNGGKTLVFSKYMRKGIWRSGKCWDGKSKAICLTRIWNECESWQESTCLDVGISSLHAFWITTSRFFFDSRHQLGKTRPSRAARK